MSNKFDEQFTSAIGLGELLEKPEGEDMQTDTPIESYTIVCKNRSFGRVVRMSYETVADTQKLGNLLQGTVGTWGRMLPITKEKFYAKFFNNGALTAGHDVFDNSITGVVTDASGDVIYDSQPWFDSAHADKVGNTYSNLDTSASLTEANLRLKWTIFTTDNNRDERGEIIDIEPNTLLIPPALRFTADAILNSTLIPGSMDNDTNVLRTIVSPLQWHYLSESTSWLLLTKGQGLMATDRQDVELDFWQDEHFVPSISDDSRITSLIAGTPLETMCYNVTGNGKRESSKNHSIGQSAAKLLSNCMEKVQRSVARRISQVREKWEESLRDYDMICTLWKHKAALISGISLTN